MKERKERKEMRASIEEQTEESKWKENKMQDIK